MNPGQLTYTDIWNQFLRNINATNQSTNTDLINSFNFYLGQRYQLVLSKLHNYKTIDQYSFSVGMQANDLTTGITVAISTITSSGTTATVTTATAHGFSSNDSVTIKNVTVSGGNINMPGNELVDPAGFNGNYTITVTSTTTFTYTLSSSLNGASGQTSQFYPYPPGNLRVEAMYLTVGNVNMPMKIITSAYQWEQLNAIQIQASALPQFYYPRRDDFGIWPTPQAVYNGNISYSYRDRNLLVADYTSGTVTLTQGSNIVTGSSTTFTSAMVGRWLVITDTSIPGQGYFFRITGYTDSTHITLYEAWNNATVSGASYRIGECPEIPAEGHVCLVDGVTADFYNFVRKDPQNGALYNNSFWTGDPSNPLRKQGDSTIAAGVINLINMWASRDDQRIISRRPHLNPLQYKVWATSLSS